jgi:hypothetical protein
MVNEGSTALIVAPVGIVLGNLTDEVDGEDQGHHGHGEDRERHDATAPFPESERAKAGVATYAQVG